MFKKSIKFYIALTFFIIVVGILFYILKNNETPSEEAGVANINNVFSSEESDNGLGEVATNNSSENSNKPEDVKSENKSVSFTKIYTDKISGFSFNYPNTFKMTELGEEDDKKVLTLQNAKSGRGLQIYITPHNDPSFVVSAEKIKRDIPDLPFSNSANIVVGGKAEGVAFFSENPAFGGPTAEVWFADKKLFYQATASTKDVKILEEIVKSWKF